MRDVRGDLSARRRDGRLAGQTESPPDRGVDARLAGVRRGAAGGLSNREGVNTGGPPGAGAQGVQSALRVPHCFGKRAEQRGCLRPFRGANRTVSVDRPVTETRHGAAVLRAAVGRHKNEVRDRNRSGAPGADAKRGAPVRGAVPAAIVPGVPIHLRSRVPLSPKPPAHPQRFPLWRAVEIRPRQLRHRREVLRFPPLSMRASGRRAVPRSESSRCGRGSASPLRSRVHRT